MVHFEWDSEKELLNIIKHGVHFRTACKAFLDPYRIIALDSGHRMHEKRLFCIGKVEDQILTVRFTYREGQIRIFGAGYWRKGRMIYEQENQNR